MKKRKRREMERLIMLNLLLIKLTNNKPMYIINRCKLLHTHTRTQRAHSEKVRDGQTHRERMTERERAVKNSRGDNKAR